MLTPAARLDETVVGCAAEAVRPPLVERALVGRSPAAVVAEPLMRVGDRLSSRAGRRNQLHALSAGGQHSNATTRWVDLDERTVWDRCHRAAGTYESR